MNKCSTSIGIFFGIIVGIIITYILSDSFEGYWQDSENLYTFNQGLQNPQYCKSNASYAYYPQPIYLDNTDTPASYRQMFSPYESSSTQQRKFFPRMMPKPAVLSRFKRRPIFEPV